MVEFHNVATFDAVWLSRWRRAKVRAYIRESAPLLRTDVKSEAPRYTVFTRYNTIQHFRKNGTRYHILHHVL